MNLPHIQPTDAKLHICRQHNEPDHTHPGWYDCPTGSYDIPDDGQEWGYVGVDKAAEANALIGEHFGGAR
jgi:hypothetical protein